MIGAAWRLAAELAEGALAICWCVRTRTLTQRIGEIADLSEAQWDLCPTRAPGLIVIVPARNEAAALEPAMATLLAQDYPWLRILAVDDRSTDGTGVLLDRLTEAHLATTAVLHLEEIPEDWLGRSFAFESVTARSQSQYLLFTEADVWMSPSLMRRALAYAELTGADHLVVMPTAEASTWAGRTLVGFVEVCRIWLVRPWRVSDPRARWDAAASEAFSLIRREAWEELGGWAPQRLAVNGAQTLGRRMRAGERRQRIAFATGLVLTHGAPGALGIVRRLSRKIFPAVDFHLSLLAALALAMVVVFLAPLAGLFWWPTILPGVLVVACIAVTYKTMAEIDGIPARFGFLFPLALLMVLWAMVRSATVTLVRRGVRWRGTTYPLEILRGQNSPFRWE